MLWGLIGESAIFICKTANIDGGVPFQNLLVTFHDPYFEAQQIAQHIFYSDLRAVGGQK